MAFSCLFPGIPAKAGTHLSSTRAAAHMDPGKSRGDEAKSASSVDEPVKLGGVLAGDLVDHFGREPGELFFDVFRRLRPHPVRVRVVRAPHQGFETDLVDQLGPDAVELEGRLALALPVIARLHLHQVAETVLVLEIHPVERVGQPADAALAKADPQVGITLQDAGADDRGDDLDQVHLEPGHGGELRLALHARGQLVAHPLRNLREGVEVQRQLDVVDRLPQLVPARVPHRLHVPRARQFQPAQAELGDAVDLLRRRRDIAIGQAGEAANEMLRIYNDWLKEFCSHYPDRQIGLACLPYGDIEAAAKEVYRVAKLGLRGLELSCSWDMEPMWHPCWDPLWKAVNDVQLPLHFHTFPAVPQRERNKLTGQTRRMAQFTSVAGFQMNLIQIIAAIIGAGVLERYPNLRVGFG